jgi:hypothetical protein
MEGKKVLDDIKRKTNICTVTAQAGTKTIFCSWKLIDREPTEHDWIGFYNKNNPNKNYRTFHKTRAREGHFIVDSPNTPGLYEFRFFSNGSYEDIARSDVIYIGPTISLVALPSKNGDVVILKWEITKGESYLSPKDWFGFYHVKDRNKEYKKKYSILMERIFPGLLKPKEDWNLEIMNLDFSLINVVILISQRVMLLK